MKFNDERDNYLQIIIDNKDNDLDAVFLYDIPDEILENKNFVLEVIKHGVDIRRYLSEDLDKNLLQDEEIFIALCKEDPSFYMEFASDEFIYNKKIVLEAVRVDGNSLEFVSDTLKHDREVVLDAVQCDGQHFTNKPKWWSNNALEFVSRELQDDYDIVFEAVTNNGTVLEYASKRLRDNEDIVFAAANNNLNSLKYASKRLKSDVELRGMLNELSPDQKAEILTYEVDDIYDEDESEKNHEVDDKNLAINMMLSNGESNVKLSDRLVALAALENSTEAFEKIAETLKNDKSFVLEAIVINPFIYKYLTDDLKKDMEIVSSGYDLEWRLYKLLPDEIKTKKEICISLLSRCPGMLLTDYFKELSDSLKNDEDVIDLVFEICEVKDISVILEEYSQIKESLLLKILRTRDGLYDNHLYKIVPYEFKCNKDFVLKCMEINPFIFQIICSELQDDEDVVNKIPENKIGLLKYASWRIRQDKVFMSKAMLKNPYVLLFASDNLLNDYEFCQYVINKNILNLQYIHNESILNNKELLLKAINAGASPSFLLPGINFDQVTGNNPGVNKSFLSDHDIALATVKKQGTFLYHLSDKMKNDIEIVLSSVQENGVALEYASEKLKNNFNIIEAALKSNWLAIQYVPTNLIHNIDVLMILVEHYPDISLCKDSYIRQIIGELKSLYITPLRNADEKKLSDKEFVLKYIGEVPLFLKYVAEKLKDDDEVVIAATEKNQNALEFASVRLKKDKNILKKIAEIKKAESLKIRNNKNIFIPTVLDYIAFIVITFAIAIGTVIYFEKTTSSIIAMCIYLILAIYMFGTVDGDRVYHYANRALGAYIFPFFFAYGFS